MAGRGVAIREYPLKPGHGYADYLLYVDGQAVGVIEAKQAGTTLKGVERQSEKYGAGIPDGIPAPIRPLPFLYESTGVETRFTNRLDPEPRSRARLRVPQPTTLADWIATPVVTKRRPSMPSPKSEERLRRTGPRCGPACGRCRRWSRPGSGPPQITAVRNLEAVPGGGPAPRADPDGDRQRQDVHRRSAAIYRLIKFGGAQRVLFLVDRGNLGRQALKEFQQYDTPDDGRKFTELYNVQHLPSNTIDPVAQVVIYDHPAPLLDAARRGRARPDAGGGLAVRDGAAAWSASRCRSSTTRHPDRDLRRHLHRRVPPLDLQPVAAGAGVLRRLPDRPDRHALASRPSASSTRTSSWSTPTQQAVADGVNVDFDVYRIRTADHREQGSTVEAGLLRRQARPPHPRRCAGRSSTRTCTYDGARSSTATWSPRTRSGPSSARSATGCSPRSSPAARRCPKTLIFAKDDSHAEDIVQIVREEFGKGNDFCQKITYRTTGAQAGGPARRPSATATTRASPSRST